MQRFWRSGSSIGKYLRAPQLKRKSLNSWSAVQDTYYSAKDIFERHRVVFTISTSIASVATAWAGYTIRRHHESRVEQKLESIEKASCKSEFKRAQLYHYLHWIQDARYPFDLRRQKILDCMNHKQQKYPMKSEYQIEDPEFKKLVSGTVSLPACIATAGTTLIIGYGLGWRGGKWYANRKFRREQMKLLGQIKPKKWALKFLRRPLLQPKLSESATKSTVTLQKDTTVAQGSGHTNVAC